MMGYQIGEVVLMEWNGWLKAFRVVGAQQVQYQMAMLEMENGPQWSRPDA
jgi:hypothetical protein